MRDKIHDESLVKWAEFVRTAPREKWKKPVNVLINSTYQKSHSFYVRLLESEKGRKILERLKAERVEKQIDKLRELRKKSAQRKVF